MSHRNSKDEPVFQLDLGNPQTPQVRIVPFSKLTEDQQRFVNTEAFRERAARLRLVASRGPAPIAVQEEPLAEDAVALVRHDPASPNGRMIVVSEATLTEEVLARARHVLFTHELQPESDLHAAELTLWLDGRVRTSTASGTSEAHRDVRIFNIERRALARAIRKRLPSVAPSTVAGLGTVRVIDPKSL